MVVSDMVIEWNCHLVDSWLLPFLHSFTNKQKSWCVCVYTCCAPMNTFFPSNFACLYASKKLSSFLYFNLDTCLSSMSGWIMYVSFPFPGLVVLFFIAICSNWILSRSLSPSPATLLPFSRFCVKVALRSFVTFCPAYPNYQVFRVGLSTRDPEAV